MAGEGRGLMGRWKGTKKGKEEGRKQIFNNMTSLACVDLYPMFNLPRFFTIFNIKFASWYVMYIFYLQLNVSA